MSWFRRENIWEAYVVLQPSMKKKRIGYFLDEVKAAEAVDARRKAIVRHPACILRFLPCHTGTMHDASYEMLRHACIIQISQVVLRGVLPSQPYICAACCHCRAKMLSTFHSSLTFHSDPAGQMQTQFERKQPTCSRNSFTGSPPLL